MSWIADQINKTEAAQEISKLHTDLTETAANVVDLFHRLEIATIEILCIVAFGACCYYVLEAIGLKPIAGMVKIVTVLSCFVAFARAVGGGG